jgi:hypothetical protein
MKKALFVLLVPVVFSVFGSCVSVPLDYPQPAFDKPLGYVIDANAVDGRIEDYVKLRNNSRDSNISFIVYVHDPVSKQWITFGIGVLKGAGDTDTIDSDIDGIDNYRYFAVESLNEKDYAYRATKSHDDLYITILDK